MNYGNSNDVIQECPKCTNNIDKHKLSLIRSSDKTDTLARKLQDNLTKINLQSALKGLSVDSTATMVGAAIVNYQSSSQTYITVSGPGVVLLSHININEFGKKVIIIKDYNALVNKNKIRNCRKGITFVPDTSKGTEYPVGSCAAQKLLSHIFEDAKTFNSIKSIEMSEIMWRAPKSKVREESRKWTVHTVVPSCKTCKQVVPQMLCDLF